MCWIIISISKNWRDTVAQLVEPLNGRQRAPGSNSGSTIEITGYGPMTPKPELKLSGLTSK
jgi:hypothetical protein